MKAAKITKNRITYPLVVVALIVGLLFATTNSYAAPLTNVEDKAYPGVVGVAATHTIKFTTATNGTINYVQIIFEATFDITGVQLGNVSGIGPGTVAHHVTDNDVVYTVTAPAPVPGNTDVSMELKNIVNTPNPGNYTVTVTTFDSTPAVIDGPTASAPFTISPPPTVISVTPNIAPQGSTLDVTIEGTNFQGTAGQPFAGTIDFGAGITVNSTIFVSNTELSANITIAQNAPIGKHDVTVTNGDAGVGVGIGIFTVLSLAEGPTIDIECDKDIYKVGEPLTVLLDLNNPGDAFNAVIGLFYIGVGVPVLPVLLVPTSIPAGFNILDYPLFFIPSIPPGLPPTNAFVCVLLDRDTGELLDWDVDIFGIITAPTAAERADIEHKAAKFVKTLTFADMADMKPVSLDALLSPKFPFSNGRALSRPAPKATALGSAYPAFANPEVWIPYQLAEPVEVRIKIYNASGQLIRTLSIGQREAGYYLNKDKAAYWDGRSDTGERVSSGIYFYTLFAGDFVATRKLVILK